MVAIPGVDHLGHGFASAVLSFTRGVVPSRVLALAVVAATTVVAGGSALYFLPKLEYLPEGNRNLIFGVILPPPGYNLETKTAIAERIEDASRPLWASETGPEPEPGGPPKIRHFFMSTLTSVFGMLPLVVFPGAGSELYRGLGSGVIGGLSLSAVLTLLLIPPMLSVLLVKGEAMVRGAEALPEPAPAE